MVSIITKQLYQFYSLLNICFQTMKWLQLLLFSNYYSIKYHSFIQGEMDSSIAI